MNDTEMSAESSVTNDDDDPVAVTILTLLTEMEPGKTLTPESAARSFAEGRHRRSLGRRREAAVWRAIADVVP